MEPVEVKWREVGPDKEYNKPAPQSRRGRLGALGIEAIVLPSSRSPRFSLGLHTEASATGTRGGR